MRFTQAQMEILVRCLHQNQITEAEFILLLEEPAQPKNDVFPPSGWIPYNPWDRIGIGNPPWDITCNKM